MSDKTYLTGGIYAENTALDGLRLSADEQPFEFALRLDSYQLKELDALRGVGSLTEAVEQFAAELIRRLTDQLSLWESESDDLAKDGRENSSQVARARQARHSIEVATGLLAEFRGTGSAHRNLIRESATILGLKFLRRIPDDGKILTGFVATNDGFKTTAVPTFGEIKTQHTVDVCAEAHAYIESPEVQEKATRIASYTEEADGFVRQQILHALEVAYLDGMHAMRRLSQ
jgi:hypothetical protein